jgi:DNA-binding NtrC family response regulator
MTSTLGRTRERSEKDARNAPQSWQLLVLVYEGERPLAGGLDVTLTGTSELLLGRGSRRRLERDGDTARLRVPDEWMSSSHARVVRRGSHWQLEDLRSKNGSVVNGMATPSTTLRDGDVIELGQTFFVYREHELARLPGTRGEAPLVPTREPGFAVALEDLAAVATAPLPILLAGETGTGKEVLARAVHERSRRGGAFVAVNCGALPETLVETELFGYKKGAFSGATEDRLGLVRSADGGTLFLDEIGDLPLSSQATLLRVLQEREVTPVGAARPVKVDLRVIAASHRDLPAMAADEEFREDLLQRLSGFTMTLPPLRERREDLGDLAAAFLARATSTKPPRLTPAAARLLLTHAWPGNVRELEQALSAAVVLARGEPIGVEHLPKTMREGRSPARATAAPSLSPAQEAHRAELETLLREHDGNVAAVARVLGKGRMQVHRWMTRYKIDPEAFRRG